MPNCQSIRFSDLYLLCTQRRCSTLICFLSQSCFFQASMCTFASRFRLDSGARSPIRVYRSGGVAEVDMIGKPNFP